MADEPIREEEEEEEAEVEGHGRGVEPARGVAEGQRDARGDDDSDDVEAHIFKEGHKDDLARGHKD